MKRKAIILSVVETIGQEHLHGCSKDSAHWNYYLRSAAGGAWEDNEITFINNPNYCQFLNVINNTAALDFLLVCFSGHGFTTYKDRLAAPVQYVVFSDGQSVPISMLHKCKRQINFFDTCSVNIFLEGVFTPLKIDEVDDVYLSKFRDLFYHTNIMNKDSYIVDIFGTGLGQVASENPYYFIEQGGLATYKFLSEGVKHSKSLENKKTLSLRSHFNSFVNQVSNSSNSKQLPEFTSKPSDIIDNLSLCFGVKQNLLTS